MNADVSPQMDDDDGVARKDEEDDEEAKAKGQESAECRARCCCFSLVRVSGRVQDTTLPTLYLTCSLALQAHVSGNNNKLVSVI